MVTILDGKALSIEIQKKLKKEIQKLGVSPCLAIIQIGDNKESGAYIEHKKRFANEIGIKIQHITLDEMVKERDVIEEIRSLNKDRGISGIILQLPLPKHLDKFKLLETIDPSKDVDGLHSKNAGLLYESAGGGNDPKNITVGMIPATARGVMSLLKKYKIKLVGKRAIVVGRSMLVGKPVALLLLKENATVTVAHSKTEDLPKLIKEHDIVIIAVGKPKYFGKECFRAGQVVVDVGTNSVVGSKVLEEGVKRTLVGDVDFEKVAKIVSAISPVPGGVGPMTVASLFENVLNSFVSKEPQA